jgi:hypothetical protein
MMIETEHDTLGSLRQLIEANDRRINDILNERDSRYQQRFEAALAESQKSVAAAKDATDKAEAAIERRFSIANEWRGSINDVIGTRLSREEFQQAQTGVLSKIDDATRRVLTIEGRSSGIGSSLSVVFSAVALLISLIFGTLTFIHSTGGVMNPWQTTPSTQRSP